MAKDSGKFVVALNSSLRRADSDVDKRREWRLRFLWHVFLWIYDYNL